MLIMLTMGIIIKLNYCFADGNLSPAKYILLSALILPGVVLKQLTTKTSTLSPAFN